VVRLTTAGETCPARASSEMHRNFYVFPTKRPKKVDEFLTTDLQISVESEGARAVTVNKTTIMLGQRLNVAETEIIVKAL
jgi:hypothetical protein